MSYRDVQPVTALFILWCRRPFVTASPHRVAGYVSNAVTRGGAGAPGFVGGVGSWRATILTQSKVAVRGAPVIIVGSGVINRVSVSTLNVELGWSHLKVILLCDLKLTFYICVPDICNQYLT